MRCCGLFQQNYSNDSDVELNKTPSSRETPKLVIYLGKVTLMLCSKLLFGFFPLKVAPSSSLTALPSDLTAPRRWVRDGAVLRCSCSFRGRERAS